MTSVLFLGNSHLSALKLASYSFNQDSEKNFKFFCARGVDLLFTEVASGKLKPKASAEISERHMKYFYGRPTKMSLRYLETQLPSRDVAGQFLASGGEPEIDLADLSAVFYVAGISPYDFRCFEENSYDLQLSDRYAVLASLLGKDYFLYDQISAIRELYPICRHYFIGRPLLCGKDKPDDLLHKRSVIGGREQVRSLSKNFLFDAVYIPSEELLTGSLLATKMEYSINGLRQAREFLNINLTQGQNEQSSHSDVMHMNALYGKVLFRDFIMPLVELL